MQAEQRNGSHSTGSMSKKMAVADQVGALKEALSLSLLKRDEEQMIEKAKSMRIPVEDVKKAQAWLLSEFPDIFQAQKGKQQGNLVFCWMRTFLIPWRQLCLDMDMCLRYF